MSRLIDQRSGPPGGFRGQDDGGDIGADGQSSSEEEDAAKYSDTGAYSDGSAYSDARSEGGAEEWRRPDGEWPPAEPVVDPREEIEWESLPPDPVPMAVPHFYACSLAALRAHPGAKCFEFPYKGADVNVTECLNAIERSSVTSGYAYPKDFMNAVGNLFVTHGRVNAMRPIGILAVHLLQELPKIFRDAGSASCPALWLEEMERQRGKIRRLWDAEFSSVGTARAVAVTGSSMSEEQFQWLQRSVSGNATVQEELGRLVKIEGARGLGDLSPASLARVVAVAERWTGKMPGDEWGAAPPGGFVMSGRMNLGLLPGL
jgi:hypothetical protein